MNLPDYNDVQGIVVHGYKNLTQACYLLLRIRDAAAARDWIGKAPITTAEEQKSPPTTALQIAFTPSGLRALGVAENMIAQFSREFIEGMAGDANRSRRLGDTGANHPKDWYWGGPDKPLDLVVMLFAKENLDVWQQQVQKAPWNDAFEEIAKPLTTADMHGREPFGFADGISQPVFDWKRERTTPGTTVDYSNEVALGELLLGYPNEYGKYTDRPLLDTVDDPADDLLPAEDHTASKDLALNGTYFVLRQLEQDVRGFWRYIEQAAGPDPTRRDELAAAMVGRTLDGDPLIPASGEHEKPGEPRNAFTYDQDPMGTQCPFGAHIRRANPRNADYFGHPREPVAKLGSLLGIPPPQLRDDLIASTRFHRILRRGREYREPSGEHTIPGEEPATGLHFGCLGANIGRQFEFVQNAWLMSTKFNGLNEESDPLLGNRAPMGDCPVTGNFSIPREGKVARRLTALPQFVTVRGGAYFFLPSLRALRYITRA